MRVSVVTKRSDGDVNTLDGQSNAFNQTPRSPNRAFNQSIATFKNKKPIQTRKSPALTKNKRKTNIS